MSVECINEADESILSFLILKEINLLHKWVVENQLNEDACLATSDTDYSNDVLALNWLKHFDKQSKKTQKKAMKLLLINEY